MRTILTVLLLAAFATAGTAMAWNNGGGGLQCVPTRGGDFSKCYRPKHPPTVSIPTTTTTTTPTTTVTLPPPVQAPPGAPDGIGFCVQTLERGNTFVSALPDSFKPGGDWYKLWSTNSKVILDGHVVTLQYEGGKGLILAPNVKGVGLTCDQPYVPAVLP